MRNKSPITILQSSTKIVPRMYTSNLLQKSSVNIDNLSRLHHEMILLAKQYKSTSAQVSGFSGYAFQKYNKNQIDLIVKYINFRLYMKLSCRKFKHSIKMMSSKSLSTQNFIHIRTMMLQ